MQNTRTHACTYIQNRQKKYRIITTQNTITALYAAETWDDPGSRSETPGKFRNVVLEKDGEDQLDRSSEK